MEIANIILAVVSLLTSLILSGFAIWLSFVFYNKAKESEKTTVITLEAIKTQTSSLQLLTSKMIDRLTKHATSPQKADEITLRLFELYTLQTTTLRVPSPDDEAITSELISCYIAIYYYAGLTNVAAQGLLPPIEQLEEDNGVKAVVDLSHTNFVYMEDVIGKIDKRELAKNPLSSWYTYAFEQIKSNVRDTALAYSSREESTS